MIKLTKMPTKIRIVTEKGMIAEIKIKDIFKIRKGDKLDKIETI